MNPFTSPPRNWAEPVKRIQRLAELGWFVDRFNRWCLAFVLPFALLTWTLRVQRVPLFPLVLLAGLGLTAAVLDSWLHARERRLPMSDALARLDHGWNCHGQLLGAYAGRCAWPPEAPEASLPVIWRWKPCLPPGALLGTMVGLALILPLPLPPSTRTNPAMEPPDWRTLERLAEDLREQDLVREEDLRILERQVQSLRAKDPGDWYAPASLEASDLLRERTRNDTERLARGLSRTASLLQQVADRRQDLPLTRREEMRQRLANQLENLQRGNMRPGEKLERRLSRLDPSALSQMDQQSLDSLRQMLEANARGLQQGMLGAGMAGIPGDLFPPGPDGGGPADLSLKDYASYLRPAAPVALPASEGGEAQIGDLLQVREGEHEEKDRPEIAERAGELSTPGGGGEVIWRQNVLPAEEKILEAYFK